MAEQRPLTSEDYWFSLITAAPVAELPERAAVAVVFGNGQPVALRFEDDLPRLHGLAASDTRHSFRELLRWARAEVESGRGSIDALSLGLGPQFRIEPPRLLTRQLTDDVISIVAKSLLKAPPPPRDDPVEAVVRLSRRILQVQIARSRINPGLVVKRAHPRDLYASLHRVIPTGTPRVEVAVRGSGRDALIDGIAFGKHLDPAQVRDHAGRISLAFWELGRELRPLLKEREGRVFRLVGVVQRPDEDASDDMKQVRGFALEAFETWADVVIDGAKEDPVEALSRESDWVGSGT